MPYKDIAKSKESAKKSFKKNYAKNRTKYLTQQKAWRESIKLKVIDHYSSGTRSCKCCGETVKEFLTVDHVNNDGTQQRKKFTGGGHHNYRYIIKNKFPEGFQILCFNCNCGRARTLDKVCPHMKKDETN